MPAWVSFSCRDDRHVSHGETLKECVRALEGCARVAAVGINCTPPRFIQSLVTEARKVSVDLLYGQASLLYHDPFLEKNRLGRDDSSSV